MVYSLLKATAVSMGIITKIKNCKIVSILKKNELLLPYI
jgi:hypothetical protein